MASLRSHKRSPFWYVRFRDIDTGRWVEECTKKRRDSDKDTREAQRICDKKTELEARISPDTSGNFAAWVSSYIEANYRNENSRRRYTFAWEIVSEWLKLRNIRHPRQIRYLHAMDFLNWRTGKDPDRLQPISGVATHNSARLELKFFSFIMREAIRREACEKNPLAEFKIERKPPKEKPELEPGDYAIARSAFRKDWMRVVFEILAHLGCRFSEASIPMKRIDFAEKLIWLEDSKRDPGDPRKLYCVPLPDQLATTLLPLKDQDRTVPVLTREMNARFNEVLRKAVGATSHSLRVSFISRCHRSGLSESEAMRLVNHSSRIVHRVYTRLNLQDARVAQAKIVMPPPP